MQIITMTIKLTLEDVKNYIVAKYLRKKIIWVISILLIFFLLFTLIGLIMSSILSVRVSQAKSILLLFSGCLIVFLGLLLFLSIPFLIEYLSQIRSFHKNVLLAKIYRYEITNHCFNFSFETNTFSYQWNDISRVEEFKSCFMITFFLNKYILIPRRAFKDQAELTTFINMIETHVAPSKRVLVKYQVGWDFESLSELTKIQLAMLDSTLPPEQPLLKIRVSLSLDDCIAYISQNYYGNISRINQLILAIVFLSAIVWPILSPGTLPLTFNIIFIIAGIIGFILTVLPTVLLASDAKRAFAQDRFLHETSNYQFYSSYYYVNNPILTAYIRYNEVSSLMERRDFFVLRTTANVIHVIPKRFFAADSEINIFRNFFVAQTNP